MQFKEREDLITPADLLTVILLVVLFVLAVSWLADSTPEVDKVDIKGMQETAQQIAEQGVNR